MITDFPPITTICLLRCPGCTEPALKAFHHPRRIVTRDGAICGCTGCGWRGLMRIRQGLATLQIEFQALKPVDLSAPRPEPAGPQPPEVAEGFAEIYQSGLPPDGVSWSV